MTTTDRLALLGLLPCLEEPRSIVVPIDADASWWRRLLRRFRHLR